MGSKHEVTEKEMSEWKDKIYDLASNCAYTKDKYMYYLLVIWIYEYIETSVVNNKNEHAGLTPVKKEYPLYSEALVNLFMLRCQITHTPYRVDEDRLSRIKDDSDKINNVLCSLGFSRPVLTIDNQYLG